jgi:tetratricopeptide (TPR) repeat protein
MQRRWGLVAAVVAATAVAYWPAWFGTPVWDDGGHLTGANLQSVEGLWRIWVSPGATQQYYPLTHTAFWIQSHLWGDAWVGYHLTNIALHALSACVLAVVLERLRVKGAWLAALIFALHPVHVESVAWMSELKNTLSGALFLGAVLVYLRFDADRRASMWVVSALLFCLALLSKTTTATLPVVVLLIVWWRQGRLEWRRDVWPLVPFAVVAAVMAVVTIAMEREAIGAVGAEFNLSPVERVLVAGRATWFYLASLVWPVGLSFNYPRWRLDASSVAQWLFPLALLGTFVLLFVKRGQWGRGPLAALAGFVVMAAPALGFVSVYPFRFSFVADHFQYLASLSAIAAVSAGLAVYVAPRVSMATRRVGVMALGGVLMALTWQQSGAYQSEEALYRATIARNPTSWLAHGNLASLLLQREPPAVNEALHHARLAVDGRSDGPSAQYTLGLALELSGEPQQAAAHYREAIASFGGGGRHVRLSQVHHRLGAVLVAVGDLSDAAQAFREGLRHDAVNADIHADLAMVLVQQRDFEGATRHFETAAELRPSPASWTNLAGVFMQSGRFAEAVPWLERATEADPTLVDAFHNLGVAFAQLGRVADALTAFRRVLEAEPNARQVQDYVRVLEARLAAGGG